MKHLIVGILLTGFAAGASAWNDNTYDYDVNSNYNSNSASASAGASAGAAAVSSNRNTNRQGQNQGQLQGQGQGQFQGNVGLGSGNSTGVNVGGDTFNTEYKEVKQDVPAYAPNAIAAPATAPCYATWAASGGGMGVISLGGSGYVKDHGCALGEVARVAAATGNKAIADEAVILMFALVKEEAGLNKKTATATEDDGFAWQRDYE